MEGNHHIVSEGFKYLLNALVPYIAQELQAEFGDDWWDEAVMNKLYEEQKRNLPQEGTREELLDSLDIQRALRLFDIHWMRVFRKKLSLDHRNWEKELVGVRNRLAHLGGNDFSDADTWRALDTMARLCEQIDPDANLKIRALLRKVRYGSEAGSTQINNIQSLTGTTGNTKKISAMPDFSGSGLPSWRDVIHPHPDVAQGLYKNAEFAADLAQVSRGEGSIVYQDAVEFFARTYVTDGMSTLLVQAINRVCENGGEPVIQLKTAFGGGKTHSMLALYHMLRGLVPADSIPNLKPVMAQAGVDTLPKVNVAVLVGTALNPTKSRRPNHFPGITINTLWGEMAAQLVQSANNAELYEYVKEADKKGVSPGSETLKNLLDACGPCLILIDELVAYGKKIYRKENLPSGTFDNFITFIQELTEAARASKNSLIVASIPESKIEIGEEGGQQVLEVIEHTFGRVEAIWKPVAANEAFEVVRRRLFLDCREPELRDQVCLSFARMYRENPSDFPLEAKELDYYKRMVASYPIHPEIFDRLYEDWATLERFQRTRGVLRLMAAVIHSLWMEEDSSAMIMPGSIQMDVPNVRDELTRHLSEGWNAIVDREVDGKNSIPYQKDKAISRYGGKMAARRVARTIMLGSAPTDRAQAVRGIEASRIRLGVVRPGETIADYNDALNTLKNSLAYLYTNRSGDRYWFDTRPTLRKTAEDRATQLSEADVEHEIESRLGMLRKEPPLAGVHICPASSLDVPDEQNVRLVLLRPEDGYRNGIDEEKNKAILKAENILNTRGTGPRIYRNMLAFVAPDHEAMGALKDEVRRYLAWKSIKSDSEDLNLDAAQNRETEHCLNRSHETVELRIREAYCWLLLPYIDRAVDIKNIIWDKIQIRGGSDSIVRKAANKMIEVEALITEWAPALLLMELNNVLWKDSDAIEVKKLWEFLCTYCYLPRLADRSVLVEAISKGVRTEEYFALAAGKINDHYLELKFNQYVSSIEPSAWLVKMEVAKQQLQEEERRKKADSESETAEPDGLNPFDITYPEGANSGGDAMIADDNGQPVVLTPPEVTPAETKNTHFYLSAKLDNTRINRDVQRLVEEVITHLTNIDGGQVEIRLEVSADVPDGISQSVVRTVSENLQTLKHKNFGFDS